MDPMLNTISSSRELNQILEKSGYSLNQAQTLPLSMTQPLPMTQNDPPSVRPKRLNPHRRHRRVYNRSNFDEENKRRRPRNRNKNAKLSNESSQLKIDEQSGAGALESYEVPPSFNPYASPFNPNMRPCNDRLNIQSSEFNKTFTKLPVAGASDYTLFSYGYSSEPCLGILHEKMDPEKKPECAFCKRNNAKDINHLLKDSAGGVVCPVLSAFTCKMCAATGRNAHTHKYCPVNPITKGDPIAAGMPPGRPLTKVDKQWLKYFHARFILELYLRTQNSHLPPQL